MSKMKKRRAKKNLNVLQARIWKTALLLPNLQIYKISINNYKYIKLLVHIIT